MSKTTLGGYRDFEFWVFDVCQGLVFAEMIAAIDEIPSDERDAWVTMLRGRLAVYAFSMFYISPLMSGPTGASRNSPRYRPGPKPG